MVAPEPPSSGIDAESERGKDKQNASVGQPIAVHIVDQPQSETDEQKDHRKRSHRLQKANFIVGIVTLCILILYTTINYWLYETTADAFHADQRPWIGVTYIDIDEFRLRTDGTLLPMGKIRVKNFGPRVAKRVVFVGGGITANESDQICKDAERDCGAAWSFATGEGHEGWGAPSNGKSMPLGATLFPNQEYQKDFDMNGPLGALSSPEKLPIYIYVPGCVVYFDQFGGKHKTRVCFQALYNGQPSQSLTNEDWQQCRECNDAE